MFHFNDGRKPAVLPRNGEIDVLRGAAIGLVLVNHMSVAFVTPLALLSRLPIDGCGIGVALFFAVSGYIITESWRTERIHAPFDRRAFYIRRIFRIMPLSLLWLEVSLLGTRLCNVHGFFGNWDINARAGAWVLMMAANVGMNTEKGGLGALGIYWSLSVEEQFYIVVPIIMLLGRRWLAAGTAVLLLYVVVVDDGAVAKALYQFTPLLMGLLVGAIVPRDGWRADAVRLRFLRIVPWLALCILPVAANAALVSYRLYCGVYLLCALIVAAAAMRRGWLLRPAPLSRILRYVGTRSYGLYLSHFAISMFLREAWASALGHGLVADTPAVHAAMLASWLAATFGITEILHRLVEQPMIAFGRRASDALRGDHLLLRRTRAGGLHLGSDPGPAHTIVPAGRLAARDAA